MNINKQIIMSVCITASISFSTKLFSADAKTNFPEDNSLRMLDRADQVKKGDVDARNIAEELGKPNPDDLDAQSETNFDPPLKDPREQKERDIDRTLNSTAE